MGDLHALDDSRVGVPVPNIDACVEAIAHYRALHGHSPNTAKLDAWMLRAIGVSPQQATLMDLERVVMRNRKQASRVAENLGAVAGLVGADGRVTHDAGVVLVAVSDAERHSGWPVLTHDDQPSHALAAQTGTAQDVIAIRNHARSLRCQFRVARLCWREYI